MKLISSMVVVMVLMWGQVGARGHFEFEDEEEGGTDVWLRGANTLKEGAKDVWPRGADPLEEARSRGPLLTMNVEALRRYVATPHRKYSLVVLFLPGGAAASVWDCPVCPYVYGELEAVATSYAAQAKPSDPPLAFVAVDLERIRTEDLPEDMEPSPTLVYVDRNVRTDEEPPYMDYKFSGPHAEAIARWMLRVADVDVKVKRGGGWARTFYLAGAALVLARSAAEAGLRWRWLVSRRTLARAAVGWSCACCAGVLYPYASRVPFSHLGLGFVAEVVLIGTLYISATMFMIRLIEGCGGARDPGNPRPMKRPSSVLHNSRCITALVFLTFAYCGVISIFHLRAAYANDG